MGPRVLVADDSGTMRKIIIRSLNALGVTDVVEAADGEEACVLFRQHQFDLVLTDWRMPHKSGLEVLESIRSSGSEVPVILITSESEKHRVLQAFQAGVSDYLPKPFDVAALREKLETYLRSTETQA